MKILTATAVIVVAFAAAAADPSTWPTCDKSSSQCAGGKYLNPLACECFAIVQCSNGGCASGQDLLPTEECECAPYADIVALFPSGITGDDVQLSMQMGLDEAVPEIPDWRVCPADQVSTQLCPDEQFWNELACKCFEVAQCELVCPDGQALHPERECECVADEEVTAVYPDWATDDMI